MQMYASVDATEEIKFRQRFINDYKEQPASNILFIFAYHFRGFEFPINSTKSPVPS